MATRGEQLHTLKCMKHAKVEILTALLNEIEREDYQTVEQVKESINGFLSNLLKED